MRQVKPVPVRAPLVSTKVKVAAVEVPSMMSTVVVNKSNAFEASVTQPGGTHASATCTALLSDDTLTATADCTIIGGRLKGVEDVTEPGGAYEKFKDTQLRWSDVAVKFAAQSKQAACVPTGAQELPWHGMHCVRL